MTLCHVCAVFHTNNEGLSLFPSSSHQVREEMERERASGLRTQADELAMQMAAIHYQQAEKRTRVLETSRAMLTLQGQLSRQLRERRSLEEGDMAQSIHNHCSVGHGCFPPHCGSLGVVLSLRSFDLRNGARLKEKNKTRPIRGCCEIDW